MNKNNEKSKAIKWPAIPELKQLIITWLTLEIENKFNGQLRIWQLEHLAKIICQTS